MIAVNELVQQAYTGIGMAGLGESADEDMPKVGELELNSLISTLNSEGFISLTQKEIDVGPTTHVYFRKLEEGEEQSPDTIDMEAPEKVEAVCRKLGARWLPLAPMDPVQMAMKNPASLPTGFKYGREMEQGPTEPREVGIVKLNGRPLSELRLFINAKLPRYTLADRIYLSDLYNELLLSGLKYRLACFYELSEQKKADCLRDYSAARKLIKRNTASQRMMVNTPLAGGYDDAYYDAMAGAYWG